MLRFKQLSLAALIASAGITPAIAATVIHEGFDTAASASSWSAKDADTDDYHAAYSPTSGNPGGYLVGFENNPLGGTGYWIASSAFTGNLSAFAGGTLSYDFKVFTGTSYFNDVDVIISGNGKSASWTSNINPVDRGWVNFSVNLNDANFSGDPLAAILSNVTELRIRGEFISGGEIEGLDNVTLMTAAVPEPSTWAMMILGFAGLGFIPFGRKVKGAYVPA